MSERFFGGNALLAADPPRKKLRTFGDDIEPSAPVESTPPAETTPAVETTPVETTAPLKNTATTPQFTPAVVSTPPVISTPKRGYLRLPNELVDNILPTMRPAEQVVLVRLYRLAWGNGQPTCHVSMATLAHKCFLSESQTRFAVRNVEARGYIKTVGVDLKGKSRGTTYEVLVRPDGGVETTAPTESTAGVETTHIKERDKKTDLKEGAMCPDCKNTGWYYPEGVAKGVRRCKHERLEGEAKS